MSHEVRLRIDTAFVGKKDFEIIVDSSDGNIGTLLVSRGNIEWVPSGNSVNKQRMTWTQFAKFMEVNGKPVKMK